MGSDDDLAPRSWAVQGWVEVVRAGAELPEDLPDWLRHQVEEVTTDRGRLS